MKDVEIEELRQITRFSKTNKPLTEKNRHKEVYPDVVFTDDVLSALAGLKEKLDVPNPYPVDVFPEIDEKTWSNIDFLLKKYLGFPLDRVSGSIGRRLFDNYKKKMLEDMAYWFPIANAIDSAKAEQKKEDE